MNVCDIFGLSDQLWMCKRNAQDKPESTVSHWYEENGWTSLRCLKNPNIHIFVLSLNFGSLLISLNHI